MLNSNELKDLTRIRPTGVGKISSTRDLSLLPDIRELKKLCRSLATLDAIIMRNWEYRYYSFNSAWDANEQMASMSDGEGDSYFILFSPVGAILKGFDHESPMSPWSQEPSHVWPGVLDSVPAVFSDFLKEPAFSMEDTTFCIWRKVGNPSWQTGSIIYPAGDDPDGSACLLSILDGDPATYKDWAEGYYERPVNLAAIRHVYEYRPLTDEVVATLNPDVSLDDLEKDLGEICYQR